MHRTYESRCLPTGRQSRALDDLLELTRQLYNAALQEHRAAYQKGGKSVSYFDWRFRGSSGACRSTRPVWAIRVSRVKTDTGPCSWGRTII